MPFVSLSAAFVLLLSFGSAQAEVVCFHQQNIEIAQTGEGVYVNLVTGAHGGSEGAVPGFDFDPYAAQNSIPVNQLKFYWGSASSGGAGVASSGDRYAVLAPGDTVGAGSLFTRAAFTGDTSVWQAGVTAGYLGVRFKNETTDAINYGWVRLTTSAPIGFPATLIDWCYEDAGNDIVIADEDTDTIFCDGFDGLACVP